MAWLACRSAPEEGGEGCWRYILPFENDLILKEEEECDGCTSSDVEPEMLMSDSG